MSDLRRDDLRVLRPCRYDPSAPSSQHRHTEEVTDADLRALGYVKLDMDVLRELVEDMEDMRSYVPHYFAEKWNHDESIAKARQVLAALDGEYT